MCGTFFSRKTRTLNRLYERAVGKPERPGNEKIFPFGIIDVNKEKQSFKLSGEEESHLLAFEKIKRFGHCDFRCYCLEFL